MLNYSLFGAVLNGGRGEIRTLNPYRAFAFKAKVYTVPPHVQNKTTNIALEDLLINLAEVQGIEPSTYLLHWRQFSRLFVDLQRILPLYGKECRNRTYATLSH